VNYILLFWLATVVGSVAARLAAANAKAILVLHTYGYDSPFRIPFDGAFMRAVREAADLKIDVYIETLNTNQLRGERSRPPTRSTASMQIRRCACTGSRRKR